MSDGLYATVSSMAALETALQREVDDMRKAKRNTLVGTGILAVIMLSYLTYMYLAVNILIEEDGLAGQVQGWVRKSLPQAHGRIQAAMLQDAPRWAERGFDVAVAGVPDARAWVETYVDEKVESAFRDFEAKVDAQFAQELTELRQSAIRKKLEAMDSQKARKELEEEMAREFEIRYRQEAMSKLLPEFFERWTSVTAAGAMGVIRERLQAFDVELQNLCNQADKDLSPADRDRKEMVLCLAAYLESLFAEEGSRIVERLLYLAESSGKKMQLHFVGRRGGESAQEAGGPDAGVTETKDPAEKAAEP